MECRILIRIFGIALLLTLMIFRIAYLPYQTVITKLEQQSEQLEEMNSTVRDLKKQVQGLRIDLSLEREKGLTL